MLVFANLSDLFSQTELLPKVLSCSLLMRWLSIVLRIYIPEDIILCTIDVVGLYPNIQHEGGLAVIKEALDKRDDKSISTETLMELAECVLKNNIFEHNEDLYKQLRGTAIGTKMAPSYAVLFMGKLEEEFLEVQS